MAGVSQGDALLINPAHLALRYATWREADLSPPLGLPGGPCKVMERIEDKVRDPRLREKLIQKVEDAEDLSLKESSAVYPAEMENTLPGSSYKKILLTGHTQYRMDLRGVTVNDVRLVFHEWHQKWAKGKSTGDGFYRRMEDLIESRPTRKIKFEGSQGLVIVFAVGKWKGKERGGIEVVSVFFAGEPNPKPTPRTDCEPWEGWSGSYPKDMFERHFRVADLNPSLGFPGGPCQVIERIDQEVPNLRMRDKLVDLVEDGTDLSNAQSAQVYKTEDERGPSGTRFKRMLLTPHVQYRMDLRGVNVSDLRLFFKRFQKAWSDARSRQEPIARRWESDMAWGSKIEWVDSQGLFVAFSVKDRTVTVITTYWKGVPDPRPVDESACALPSRVAARHAAMQREAALRDLWLKWIVQPAKVIWEHRKEFVQGPVDDAMDIIIKELAPELVKAIGEQEVDSDLDEFLEGAQKGKWDAERGFLADPQGPTEDWEEGYSWGFANPAKVKSNLPPDLKRKLVEEAVREYRRNITEEVIERALLASWDALSPVTTFRSIWAAVKRHGWKLGLVIALVEIIETFVIPGALIAVTGDPEWASVGMLPLSEILYAVVFRILGRVPSDVDEVEEDGHLDWYEAQYGPIRLAALKMPAEPGVKTLVRDDSAKGLPTDLDRTKEQNLPLPGSATPGGAGRDIPRFEYNTPDNDIDKRPRTLGVPGEEYGHPVKDDYGYVTRRTMTSAEIAVRTAMLRLSGWMRFKGHFPGVRSPLFHATTGPRAANIVLRGEGLKADSGFSDYGGQVGMSTSRDLGFLLGGDFGKVILVFDRADLERRFRIEPVQHPTAPDEYEERVYADRIPASLIRGVILNFDPLRSEIEEWRSAVDIPVVYRESYQGPFIKAAEATPMEKEAYRQRWRPGQRQRRQRGRSRQKSRQYYRRNKTQLRRKAKLWRRKNKNKGAFKQSNKRRRRQVRTRRGSLEPMRVVERFLEARGDFAPATERGGTDGKRQREQTPEEKREDAKYYQRNKARRNNQSKRHYKTQCRPNNRCMKRRERWQEDPGFYERGRPRQRREAGLLTVPEIAFGIGPDMALGYVRSISPMTGMVTFDLDPEDGPTIWESLPVEVFLRVAAFLSDEDIDAFFELVDAEIGMEAYEDLDEEGLRACAALYDKDPDSDEFRGQCFDLTGEEDLGKLSAEQMDQVNDQLVLGILEGGGEPRSSEPEGRAEGDETIAPEYDPHLYYGEVEMQKAEDDG